MPNSNDCQIVETSIFRVVLGAEASFLQAATIGMSAFKQQDQFLGTRVEAMPGEGNRYALNVTTYARGNDLSLLAHSPPFHHFCALVDEYLVSEPEITSVVVTEFPADETPSRALPSNVEIESLLWRATNPAW